MKIRFNKVALGGTFDTLHAGHVKLLATATATAKEIYVGLTSDVFANSYKQYKVKPFEQRAASVVSLLRLIAPNTRINLGELNDPYGPAATDPS